MVQRKPSLVFLMLLILALLVPSGLALAAPSVQKATPTPIPEEEPAEEAEMESEEAEDEEAADAEAPLAPTLATAKAYTQLSNQFGRAIVSARTNHFIIDSAPPLGHPAEEINPVEAMLAALATCGLFIYETAAQEMEIPLEAATVTVHGDFDVRGLSGAAKVDSRLQAFRVHMDIEGPDDEEGAMLAEQFSTRCPVYTTLIQSAPITITTNSEEMGGPIAEGLATAKVSASLSNQPGRALVSVRDNFIVVDSVPPLGGPNKEVNPMDLLLAAQGTCGTFIMEKAALDEKIPFHGANGMVEADFDPQGLRDGSVSPHIQAMRVHWEVGTDTIENAQLLVDEWMARCPIYNTLIRATDIEVSQQLMGEGNAVLEVDFTYDMTADEFVAEVSPMAADFAAVNGLIWKIWKINADESRAGAVYLFKDAAARQAYLDSELAATVASHPALSDFRVQSYAVVRAESMMTYAPLMAVEETMSDADVGTLLEINFTYNVTPEEFMAEVSPLAEAFAATEGLRWKIWALDAENSQFSGILLFDDATTMQTFLEGDLATAIVEHPALSDFSIMPYEIMEEVSTVTRAPIR